MRCPGQYLSLLVLAVLLSGCGSSPPVRYYGLAAADVAYQVDGGDAAIIGFGPIRVPDYLKRPQIVTRGSGSELKVNDFVRWAEPLDNAIHTVVATNVDAMLSDAVVVAYPYLNALDLQYWVIGRVDRFEADQSGNVVLVLQWGMQDSERQTIVPPQRESYRASANNVDDPSAVARAMSDALTEFSRDVARKVSAALD